MSPTVNLDSLVYFVAALFDQEDGTDSALDIVEARGLRQMTDQGEIEALCKGIVDSPQHAKQVTQQDVAILFSRETQESVAYKELLCIQHLTV